MDSGETSLFFVAFSLRNPALLLNQLVAAPSAPMADLLLLFHPFVLIRPIHTFIILLGSQRLAHELPDPLHPLLPTFLANVRRQGDAARGQVYRPGTEADPVAAAQIDAAPDVDEEDGAPLLLCSPGAASAVGRTSAVVDSPALPIRTSRVCGSFLPISTALTPTSSKSRALVGMLR